GLELVERGPLTAFSKRYEFFTTLIARSQDFFGRDAYLSIASLSRCRVVPSVTLRGSRSEVLGRNPAGIASWSIAVSGAASGRDSTRARPESICLVPACPANPRNES